MKTEVLPENQSTIWLAAELLSRGETVALPTETVYGLAANALNPSACYKIFQAKERPNFDPLIVHVSTEHKTLQTLHDLNWIDQTKLSPNVRELVQKIIDRYWPGPLTLLLPKGEKIPDLVTSGLQTVAIRCPNHPVFQNVLRKSGFPLAAPSANRFGRISPTSAEDVFKELDGRIPMILDGGSCTVGLESTIIQIKSDSEIIIFRPGVITQEQFENDFSIEVSFEKNNLNNLPSAPGNLESHYAPKNPLILLSEHLEKSIEHIKIAAEKLGSKNVTLITLNKTSDQTQTVVTETLNAFHLHWLNLSTDGNLKDIAIHLYATLRKADEWALKNNGISIIETFNLQERDALSQGIAVAILDRLKKAGHQWKNILP